MSVRILSSSSDEDSWVRDDEDVPLTTRRDISRSDRPGDLKLSSNVSGFDGGCGVVCVDDMVMVCEVAIFAGITEMRGGDDVGAVTCGTQKPFMRRSTRCSNAESTVGTCVSEGM